MLRWSSESVCAKCFIYRLEMFVIREKTLVIQCNDAIWIFLHVEHVERLYLLFALCSWEIKASSEDFRDIFFGLIA